MKRTGFSRRTLPFQPTGRQWDGDVLPAPRSSAIQIIGSIREIKPILKENAIQHQGYMAIVRTLACARCGSIGLSQFCHADEGKGMAIKTDCRRGWPGCGPHNGEPGCHWFVGTSGRMSKAGRREFEHWAGDCTRRAVVAAGRWPANLPRWTEVGAP